MAITKKKEKKRDRRNNMLAGFLGWTIDAFDFSILTFILVAVAQDFNESVPAIALALTASLAMRPVGAFVFGLLADRYGRKNILMITMIFFAVVEVLSGLAPTYTVFLILRLLYGIGMGGEWGVGASLVMESVEKKNRGFLSGLLQQGYAFGFLLAAAAYYFVFPHFGWRALFFIGGAPALLMALFIRYKVKEPEAWKETKETNWKAYGSKLKKHWKLFLYLVLFMSFMNLISHGTQDLYPTFLQHHGFGAQQVAIITMISMVGAIIGGMLFGFISDKWGRRRMVALAAILGICIIPLWIYARGIALITLGAFAMQFMVQGAWGIIPAHINELSPSAMRGFFPGFAYQLGVVIASSVAYVEAIVATYYNYATAMAIIAGSSLLLVAIIALLGPENKGKDFLKRGSSQSGKP